MIDFSSLKNYDVARQIEFAFNRLPSDVVSEHIVFIVRGKLSIITAIADAVKFDVSTKVAAMQKRKYHMLLVPRGSLICEKKTG